MSTTFAARYLHCYRVYAGTVEAIEYVTVYDSPIVPEGKVSASFLVCAVRDSSTLFYINTE